MKRSRCVAATACAVSFGLAGTAGAIPPLSGQFPVDTDFVDDGASAACGFPVNVSLTGTGSFHVALDRAGQPVRVIIHENATGIMSANGIQLAEADHNTQFIDLTTGSSTQVGLVFRESSPDGGIAIMDVGRVSATADGVVTFEAGPHPALDGDLGGLCAALTPGGAT